MWLITNCVTKQQLLFKTVDDWQKFADYHNWHDYSVKFVKFGREAYVLKDTTA